MDESINNRAKRLDDIDRLMRWAEQRGEGEEVDSQEEEPCESDVCEDKVGLPGGTPDNEDSIDASI